MSWASQRVHHLPTQSQAACATMGLPWSSAFPGGRRRLPSPEGFKVDSTRCEVSAFLCSAQSPLRAQAVGGARVPRRPKESWLPPDLDISATLCQFTPSVSPFLPCLLHPHTSCYSSGPNGWLRWNSFILNVMQAHTYLVQLPHCCSTIFLKFLSCLKTSGRKPLNPALNPTE